MSAELQDVASMFALLAVELSALFLLISLLVGVLQRHVPPARIEHCSVPAASEVIFWRRAWGPSRRFAVAQPFRC